MNQGPSVVTYLLTETSTLTRRAQLLLMHTMGLMVEMGIAVVMVVVVGAFKKTISAPPFT